LRLSLRLREYTFVLSTPCSVPFTHLHSHFLRSQHMHVYCQFAVDKRQAFFQQVLVSSLNVTSNVLATSQRCNLSTLLTLMCVQTVSCCLSPVDCCPEGQFCCNAECLSDDLLPYIDCLLVRTHNHAPHIPSPPPPAPQPVCNAALISCLTSC
jgi:hypothetical protein